MTRVGLAACVACLLAACGIAGGTLEATTSSEVSSATLIDGVEVECGDIAMRDCEQAVSAIVNGVPHGENVEMIEIGPLEERLAITPKPAWSASARARMADGFVYELVLIQEVRPGPMAVDFAPR